MNDKDARDMADLAFGGSSAVSGDASEFEKTFPDHIWLDVGEASQFAEPLEKFSDLQEVTWSEDNATGYGVKYVRVDLASQASLAKRGTEPSVIEAAETLKKQLNANHPREDLDLALVWKLIIAAHAESAPSEKLAGAEAIYQVRQAFTDDPANTWRDASKDAFDIHPAKDRRIVLASHAETVPHVPAGQYPMPRHAVTLTVQHNADNEVIEPETTFAPQFGTIFDGLPNGTMVRLYHFASMQAEAPQAGWKLVPVEPTLEMCLAEWNVSMSDAHSETGTSEAAWRAMLNAAPEAPQATKDAEDEVKAMRMLWDDQQAEERAHYLSVVKRAKGEAP